MNQGEARKHFLRYLDRRLVTARLRLGVHGLLALLGSAGTATLVAVWVMGSVRWVAVGVKIGLVISCLAAWLAVAVVLLAIPLRRMRQRADLCRELERESSFSNLLVAAEEACRRRDRWDESARVSPELVRRLFDRAVRIAETIRPGRLLQLRWAGRTLLAAAAAALLLAGLLFLRPDTLQQGLSRLGRPWVDESYAPRVGLYLSASPDELIAGGDIILAARDYGSPRQEVVCELRSGSGLWHPVACTSSDSASVLPYELWQVRLTDVKETFAYRFGRDGMVTASRTVTVRHPPLLTKLSGRVIPPSYTGLAPQPLSRIPSYLELLAGSHLEWMGRVNHPLRSAVVVTTRGDTLTLQVRDDRVSGVVVVNEPFAYSFHLVDEHGLRNDTRLGFELAVAKDLQPVARLLRYEDSGILPVSGELILLAEAADDFGLEGIDLLVRREESGLSPLAAAQEDSLDNWHYLAVWRLEKDPSPNQGTTRTVDTGFGPLDLRVTPLDSSGSWLSVIRELLVGAGDLDLVPGDVLALCLEAWDNRRPGPPGRGRSRVIRLTLPSAADILTAQATEGQDHLDSLQEIQKRSQELGQDLERLDRELKKDPQPDWTRQQEIEAAVSRQQALQEELAQLTEQMQADLEALGENHLTSLELLEKMDQIAELLAEMHNEELENLLAQLREAVAKMSAEEISEAMAEIAKNQQDMVRRLDRALELLKEMAREQELEGMTSMLAKLIREQQELLEANREGQRQEEDESAKTEEGDPDRPNQTDGTENDDPAGEDQPSDEELARRQEALAEELEQLQEKMQEALERLQDEQSGDQQSGEDSAEQSSPSADELREALKKALQEMEERKPSQSMQDAALDLEQGDSSQAEQQQQEALRDLGVLYHVLLSGQQGMQMAMQQFEVSSLRRLAADLLALSSREEEIADLIPNDLRDLRAGNLTRRQFRVQKSTRDVRDRLQKLSTSNPMQTLRLLQQIDDLLEKLGRSVQSLETGRGSMAQRSARQSLGDMNHIVIGLLTQAHQLGGGGGGCPMPSMGQQLKRMAREQAGLNGLADQLRRQMQQRGLSQEMRAQMKRLQSGQQGLADSARDIAELERSVQEGNRLLGDMEHMATEMERVVQDLDQGIINEETLARQERILSRLLDAHNSARKRDFSARRESRTAQDLYKPQSADRIAPDTGESESPYRLRYQPVEKAPLEYRELVRRYFRAVEKLYQPDAGRDERNQREGGRP